MSFHLHYANTNESTSNIYSILQATLNDDHSVCTYIQSARRGHDFHKFSYAHRKWGCLSGYPAYSTKCSTQIFSDHNYALYKSMTVAHSKVATMFASGAPGLRSAS